jgi:hypothetical protein
LSGVQCPLPAGLLDCASSASKLESFSFSPGGIIGGQPPYTVTASATNGVTLAPAGGYPGITLSSNALGFSGTFPVGQTPVTLTVTDAVGAATACSFLVLIDHLTVTVADAATCAGSATTLTAQPAGGSGTYSYAWSGPNSFTASTPTISVSGAGQYTVTVTDSSGCTASGSGMLTVNQPPLVTVNTASICAGSATTLTASPSGGTTPYSYAWSNGASTASITVSPSSTTTYTVMVTDKNGCQNQAASMVRVNPGPTASIGAQTNVACSGGSNGSATVLVTGGQAPYTVSDGTTSQTGTASQTAFTFSNLAANTYQYTVTDANGCTATAPVTITQPTALTVSATLDCSGNVSATISGGTPPYSWSWTPNGWTTPYSTGVGATATIGSFPRQNMLYLTLTATDANGCTVRARVDVLILGLGFRVYQPISCSGGTGKVEVFTGGGTPPYTVTDGTTTQSNFVKFLFDEKAGTHTFTVTDANGCTATRTVTITEPDPLTVATTQTDASAPSGSDGSATATAAGGTGPYSYAWTGPNSFSASGATISNLAAGTYTVTVTDAHGCQTSAQVTINLTY